ncbi:hypothetical protein ASE28_14515 [Acidovorax sp. Root219]|nr:hypothetical protein ASE28_14515 [Acidovorax sp. Root219]
MLAPTVAHCVSLPAPQGGRALLGAARRKAGAPTLPHFVSSLPPEGAGPCLGRPGAAAGRPRLVL